ncbi:MAG: phosphoribosylglycinamide formyltransferase [Bacteroidales bacterium]
MINIAILASGSGTNAQRIIEYFKDNQDIKVQTVIVNNQKAGVIERVKSYGFDCKYFPRESWGNPIEVVEYLKEQEIDLIILAGFLSIIDKSIVELYEGRILNIHPSLLPKYGGRGMYGMNIHNAVIAAGESESGITIHYVTEVIDGGSIIKQFKCKIASDDTPETLASKIQELEFNNFPIIIEQVATLLNK